MLSLSATCPLIYYHCICKSLSLFFVVQNSPASTQNRIKLHQSTSNATPKPHHAKQLARCRQHQGTTCCIPKSVRTPFFRFSSEHILSFPRSRPHRRIRLLHHRTPRVHHLPEAARGLRPAVAALPGDLPRARSAYDCFMLHKHGMLAMVSDSEFS